MFVRVPSGEVVNCSVIIVTDSSYRRLIVRAFCSAPPRKSGMYMSAEATDDTSVHSSLFCVINTH